MEKKSVADLRAELKVLRENHMEYMPVSKLKKANISEMIGMLKAKTQTTPAAAQMKKTLKVDKSSMEMPVSKGAGASPASGKATKKHHSSHDGYTEVEEDVVKSKKSYPTMEHKKKALVEGNKSSQKPKVKESMKERMARIRSMKK